MGDFNAYKGVEDKQGGADPNSKSMTKFVNCCNSCDLMEVKFCGPRFTWRNGRTLERLDWALANLSWYTHFNEAFSEHLNWFKLDHRPILIRLGDVTSEWRTHKRFRFVAAWVTETSFKELVRSNWGNWGDWPSAISHLTGEIMEWNRSTFGNIILRKKTLTRRLRALIKRIRMALISSSTTFRRPFGRSVREHFFKRRFFATRERVTNGYNLGIEIRSSSIMLLLLGKKGTILSPSWIIPVIE